jgi:hypothetical protein
LAHHAVLVIVHVILVKQCCQLHSIPKSRDFVFVVILVILVKQFLVIIHMIGGETVLPASLLSYKYGF